MRLTREVWLKVGDREAARFVRKAVLAAARRWRLARGAWELSPAMLTDFTAWLARYLAVSHVLGEERAARAAKGRGRARHFAAVDEAVEFLRKRGRLSPKRLTELEAAYSKEALRVAPGFSDAINKKLTKVVSQAVAENVHVREGVKRIMAAEKSFAKPLCETLFRTQHHTAWMAGRLEVNAEPEIDEILWGYEYVGILDDRIRPEHEALHGTRLPKDDPRWDEIMPPNGYNCLLPGMRVYRSCGLASKALYSGPAYKIETRSGAVLFVTAHHPVLTARGWVSAQRILESDVLLRSTVNIQCRGLAAIDDEDVPTRVEDVFESLRSDGRSRFCPVSALDLHGDARFTDGKIEVVSSTGEFNGRADSVVEHEGICEGDGIGSRAAHLFVHSLCAADAFVERVAPAFGRLPCGTALADDGLPVKADGLPLSEFRLVPSPHADSRRQQELDEGSARGSDFFRELLRAHPGLVERDHIVGITKYEWSGHVYDLQTETGLIVAGGIVISNCRCDVIEIFTDETRRQTDREPPETVEVGGREVPVRPDAGFDFNPLDLAREIGAARSPLEVEA